MSGLKKIRQAVDNRLDRWDAGLDALEAQLEVTRDEAMDRVYAGQRRLIAAIERLESRLDDVGDLASDQARELRSQLEHLRVQLALGKAESRETFDSGRHQVEAAIQQAENRLAALEHGLGEDIAGEVESFVRLADRLRAEFEGAELQFALLRAEQRDALRRGRKELKHRLAELRAEAKRQKDAAGEHLDAFEERFTAGLGEFRKAFRALISGR